MAIRAGWRERVRERQAAARDVAMRASASEVLGPPAFGSPEDAERERQRLRAAQDDALEAWVAGGKPRDGKPEEWPEREVEDEVRPVPPSLLDLLKRAVAKEGDLPGGEWPAVSDVLRAVLAELRAADTLVDRRGEQLEDLREAVRKREADVSRELAALRDSLTRLDSFVGEQDRGFRRIAEAVPDRLVTVEQRLEALENGEGAHGERDALANVEESVRTLVRGVEGLAGQVQALERNVAGHEASLGALAKAGAEGLESLRKRGIATGGSAVEIMARAMEDVIAAGDEALKRSDRAGRVTLGDVVDADGEPQPGWTDAGATDGVGAEERYADALARGLSDAEARAEGWPTETRLDYGGFPVVADDRIPPGMVAVGYPDAVPEPAGEDETEEDALRRLLRQRTEQVGEAVAERVEWRERCAEATGALLRLAEGAGVAPDGPDEIVSGVLERLELADDVAARARAQRNEGSRALHDIAVRCGLKASTATPAQIAGRVDAWEASSRLRGEALQEIGQALGYVWQPRNGVPDPDRLVELAKHVRAKADAPGEAWERVAAAFGEDDPGHTNPHALASCVEDAIAERDSLRERKASDAADEDVAIVRQMRERLGLMSDGGRVPLQDPIDRLDEIIAQGAENGRKLSEAREMAARAAGDASAVRGRSVNRAMVHLRTALDKATDRDLNVLESISGGAVARVVEEVRSALTLLHEAE